MTLQTLQLSLFPSLYHWKSGSLLFSHLHLVPAANLQSDTTLTLLPSCVFPGQPCLLIAKSSQALWPHSRWVSPKFEHCSLFRGTPLPPGLAPLKTWPLSPAPPAPRLCWGFYMSLFAYLVAQMVENLPALQETQIQSLGREDPLEKRMASHSSIFAWRIPWTEEPGGLQSMRSQKNRTWLSY